MSFLNALQNLELPALLAVTFALTLATAAAVLAAVRYGVRRSGFDPAAPVPIRDTLISAISAIFALTLAFSAAGIWNDTVQARAAVQREAQALENVLALANSLPPQTQQHAREAVHQYIRRVVEVEWPAMANPLNQDSAPYSRSDRALVQLIDALFDEAAKGTASPALTAIMAQLFEARSARLARLAVADGGATPAQWISLFLLALSAFLIVAVVHNHHFRVQALAMGLYAVVVSACFFLILAHDRPFVGVLSVPPTPLQQLITRGAAETAPTVAGTEIK